jgi:hypothetical protein
MKKLLVLISLLLMLGCVKTSSADPITVGEVVDKLPALKQGVVYSLKDSEFAHASTAEIVEKWGVTLEAGYIDNGKLMTALTKELINAKDYIDIKFVKELMFRPGIYVAFDEIDTGDPEVDYGISATFLEVKF